MNMFIMWMSGNSISIFPIMMVGMMFLRPIQALFSAGQAFKAIEGDQAPLQKLVWLLGKLHTDSEPLEIGTRSLAPIIRSLVRLR